jgi:hypothetical protein
MGLKGPHDTFVIKGRIERRENYMSGEKSRYSFSKRIIDLLPQTVMLLMLDCAILLYWNRLKLFTSVVVKVRRSNKH